MYVCVGGVSMQPAELSQGHNCMWLVNDIKSSSFTCIIQGLSCASAAYLAVTGMAQLNPSLPHQCPNYNGIPSEKITLNSTEGEPRERAYMLDIKHTLGEQQKKQKQ